MLAKFFSLVFTLTLLSQGFSEETYSIRRHAYWTSTHFDIESNGTWVGAVDKSALEMKSTYEISNGWGVYGKAVVRPFSWGALRTGYKVIDVFDNGKYGLVGTIQGTSSGTFDGRFEFYDLAKNLYAIASIDLEKGVVDIVQYRAKDIHIHYEAASDENGELYWKYTKVNRWFNIQIMNAFAAFLADYYPPRKAFSP